MSEGSAYFKKCVYPHSTYLEYLAEELGLIDKKYVFSNPYSDLDRFILSETFSRKAGEAVMYQLGVNSIEQSKLKCRYDFSHQSGITIFDEVKCRDAGSKTYPTTDISATKGDFITGKEGWLIVILNRDNCYMIFDLAEYTPEIKPWTHRAKTAVESDVWITENKYCFDPAKAIYKGSLPKNWLYKKYFK